MDYSDSADSQRRTRLVFLSKNQSATTRCRGTECVGQSTANDRVADKFHFPTRRFRFDCECINRVRYAMSWRRLWERFREMQINHTIDTWNWSLARVYSLCSVIACAFVAQYRAIININKESTSDRPIARSPLKFKSNGNNNKRRPPNKFM